MKKLKHIFYGWYYLFLNRNHELAKERMKVCKKCPERVVFVCGICSCPLMAKVRYPEEQCPKDYWIE
jgi:hypothetical protein